MTSTISLVAQHPSVSPILPEQLRVYIGAPSGNELRVLAAVNLPGQGDKAAAVAEVVAWLPPGTSVVAADAAVAAAVSASTRGTLLATVGDDGQWRAAGDTTRLLAVEPWGDRRVTWASVYGNVIDRDTALVDAGGALRRGDVADRDPTAFAVGPPTAPPSSGRLRVTHVFGATWDGVRAALKSNATRPWRGESAWVLSPALPALRLRMDDAMTNGEVAAAVKERFGVRVTAADIRRLASGRGDALEKGNTPSPLPASPSRVVIIGVCLVSAALLVVLLSASS